MTDVNMDEPLPAIDIAECLAKAVPVMLNDEDGAEPDDWHPMTLWHLVWELAALTSEQLRAVATHELLEAPISDLAREELSLLRGAEERSYREQARADRAEQHLAIVAEGLVAHGMDRGLVEQLIADAAALLPVETKNG